MNKRIIAVIFVGVAVAALIALLWWWFFNRPSNIPTQTGNFGSALDKNASSSNSGNDNNGSAPTLGDASAASQISGGTYLLKTLDGQTVGSYQVSTNSDGSFSFVPTNGSSPLTGGTYILNLNGVTIGNYIATPVGNGGASTLYTFNLVPYKTSTTIGNNGGYTGSTTAIGLGTSTGSGAHGYSTGTTTSVSGGNWLSVPPTDITPVLNGGGGTGGGSSGGGGTNGGTGGGTNGGTGGGTGGNTGGTGGGGGTNGGTGGSTGGTGGGTTGGNTGGSTGTTGGSTPAGSLGIGGGLDVSNSSGTIFSSTNPFNSGTIPTIGSNANPNGGKGSNLGATLGAALVTGVAACALPALAAAIGGSFALAITGGTLATGGDTEAQSGNLGKIAVPVADWGTQLGVAGTAAAVHGNTVTNTGTTIASNLGLSINISNLIQTRVLDCFARQIAHAMLEQITRSTVAWINSGFNGAPSFVSNYDQFFTNVADSAAGAFLQSSSLSFLCSPFSLQVKIAIAQSYARTSGQQQCTLTSVINNVNGFMKGDFSSGGWPGFLTFTTEPTNNPYGAFAAGSIGIHSAAGSAVGKNQFDMSLSGGFLSIQQTSNCQDVAAKPYTGNMEVTAKAGQTIQSVDVKDNSGAVTGTKQQLCDVKNVTPGTAIAQQLNQTLGIDTQSLEMAKYFDEIITALVSKLMQNIQTQGLANLSNSQSGYVTTQNVDTGAMIQQSILQNVSSLQQSAQQLQTYSSQNISSINSTLTQATALQSCWANLANTATSATDKTQAQQNAAGVQAIITDLNNRLIGYQSQVNQANSNITSLQNSQSQAQSTTDTSQLENMLNALATQTQNQAFATDASVVNAQEDQVNLGTVLSQDNQNITTQQQACSSGSTTFTAPAVNTTTPPTPLPTTSG